MPAPISSEVLAQSAALIATPSFEGSIPWMYLDSAEKPNVTCAAGFMIPNLDAALALPWYIHDFSREARQQEIAAEYARVKAMKSGFQAGYYSTASCLKLRDVDMDKITEVELGAMATELEAHLPEIGSWPVPAQLATLDMAWNLGVPKLVGEFKGWAEAALAEDWLGCSIRCHRIGPSPQRNAWTQEQFSKAHAMTMVTA